MDAYIFRAIQGCVQVKVGQVMAGEMCIGGGQSAIEEELDGFQRACFCTHGARVTDAVASNGDPGVVLLGFLQAYFAHYTGVHDVAMAVSGYRMEVNGAEGISALDALFCGVGGVRANAFAEASKFIGIGLDPHGLVCGMAVQLTVFEHLTGGGI